nr:hypothetical protein CFP56_09012 [Quercus suber]
MDSTNRHARRGQRLCRGVWIWDSTEFLQNNADSFFELTNQSLLTDVYIHILPEDWIKFSDTLKTFNQRAYHNKVRVWAVEGDQTYVVDVDAGEQFMDGLRALIEFNDRSPTEAQFYGLQVVIDLEDGADQTGFFQNGLAASQLDVAQHSLRDMWLHKWLNVHTRASAFMRSYDMPISAAMPYWLTNYEGEPINVNWASATEKTRCIMELIMPLVDEYVVLSCHADPGWIANRTLDALEYASKQVMGGHEMPRVVASIDLYFQGRRTGEHIDELPAVPRELVRENMAATEYLLEKYDAFDGMIINDLDAWSSMPP